MINLFVALQLSASKPNLNLTKLFKICLKILLESNNI